MFDDVTLSGGVLDREYAGDAPFDAMRREELYATTGTRMLVRVFAGWYFTRSNDFYCRYIVL